LVGNFRNINYDCSLSAAVITVAIGVQIMSDQELWQWVHYSYGEDLGLSSDDDDYIPLSAEEKVQFQKQLQMEEKMAEQNSDTSLVSNGTTNKVARHLHLKYWVSK